MNIAEICTRNLVLADKDASLQQAAALMREHHVGTLVVVERTNGGMQALGVVTDRDVVIDAVARGLDVTRTPLARLAQRDLAVMRGSASLDEAITGMKQRGVRRLLVASDAGALYGLLSLDDVLDAVAHEMADLARVARAGIERESAERAPLAAPEPSAAVRIPAYTLA